MNGYVAVTDLDWFEFLAGREATDEVNFWQPKPWHGRFGVLSRGEPLLFKLRSPANAIAGVAFFERYAELPLSLAWSAFGPKNGAPSRQSMWQRIARLRREQPAWYEDFDIGCLLLLEPTFFPEHLWIPQPESFSKHIQRGKGYDLRVEPGLSLWQAVSERLELVNSDIDPTPGLFGGYGDPAAVRRRLGQGTFRILVTEAYKRECAVTRERALPTLDAAHIRPFSELETHSVQNGLLLRSDVHRLFDEGYVTVTPDYRVEASRRMKEDFEDGDTYLDLHGSRIAVPVDERDRPSPDFLAWHNENRFRE